MNDRSTRDRRGPAAPRRGLGCHAAGVVYEEFLHQTQFLNRRNVTFVRDGIPGRERTAAMEHVRTELATLMGAPADEFALARNGTEALQNLILQYRRLSPGDTVMYADLDYDEMQQAMASLRHVRGANVLTFSIPEPATTANVLDAYARQLKAAPANLKLLLVTHLSNRTGLVMPVKEIVAMARARGVDTIVDAAQTIGHLDFALRDLDADFVGFSLHKWLFDRITRELNEERASALRRISGTLESLIGQLHSARARLQPLDEATRARACQRRRSPVQGPALPLVSRSPTRSDRSVPTARHVAEVVYVGGLAVVHHVFRLRRAVVLCTNPVDCFMEVTMSGKTPSSVVIATTLTVLLGMSSATAAATFVLASKATLTTRLRSTGWTPGDKPDLIWKDVTLGNLPAADAAGNIDVSLGNLDSRVASLAVGDVLTLQAGGMSVSITLALDPGRFAWVAPGGLNQGPLVNVITNTELAAAGFTPSLVALVLTSANARIIDTSSFFDPSTDAITTTSFFDLFEIGPVFGTYRIEGILSNVTDLDTGQLLPPFSASAEFSDQIGTIVPEPSTLLLLGTGALYGVATRRRR